MNIIEDRAEAAYWNFDKLKTGNRPLSERDAFKGIARGLMARKITCDQVSWMLSAITRYLPHQDVPRVSRAREMQAYALLYEIMEVAGLIFEDDAAAQNGTPKDVQLLREKKLT
jgi:hypothetical protein